MRILVAGGTGVIGIRLLPLLVADGHKVAALSRSSAQEAHVAGLGADLVVCDVFDAQRLAEAVVAFRPDLVMHQLTDLPDDPSKLAAAAASNGRIRREGTANLIAAARAVGCQKMIAQSVAWLIPGEGGAATEALEQAVVDYGDVVLRYGQFFGPAPTTRLRHRARAASTSTRRPAGPSRSSKLRVDGPIPVTHKESRHCRKGHGADAPRDVSVPHFAQIVDGSDSTRTSAPVWGASTMTAWPFWTPV